MTADITSAGDTIYALFAFDSTHQAIAAERLLTPLGGRVCPVLREITASCGVAIRIDTAFAGAAKKLLRGASVSGWRLYGVRQRGCNVVSVRELV